MRQSSRGNSLGNGLVVGGSSVGSRRGLVDLAAGQTGALPSDLEDHIVLWSFCLFDCVGLCRGLLTLGCSQAQLPCSTWDLGSLTRD